MPISVLLIESDFVHAQAMGDALARASVDMAHEHVESLARGQQRLSGEGIDVVLLGHALPESKLDNLQDALRGRPALVGVGCADGWFAAKALRAGFCDFVVQDDALHYVRELPTQIEAAFKAWTAARDLAERAERYELALLGADLGLWHWNPRTGDSTVNERWCSMLGYTRAELDVNQGRWLSLVHPDDMGCFGGETNTPSVGQFDLEQAEFRMRHKAGHWVWVQSRGKIVQRDAQGVPLNLAGTHMDISDRKHTEQVLAERSLALEESLRQLRTTQTQLIQSEKMASLGQLVANVAHEINTPIGSVKSSGASIADAMDDMLRNLPRLFTMLDAQQQSLFEALIGHARVHTEVLSTREERILIRETTQRLLDAGVGDARRRADLLVQLRAHTALTDYLPLLHHPDSEFIAQTAGSVAAVIHNTSNINTAVERVAKIVFALKSFSRMDTGGEMVEASLREGMETVLTIYHNQIKHGITLVQNYEDLKPVYCLPDELNQVWTNLLHNALHAMQRQGTLTIGIRQVGEEAEVSVADTGCGIPDAIRSRIFDPFFTTKPTGEGSGLGLDIARKIVEKHGGRIAVHSEVGVGSSFFVYLPMTSAVGH